MLETHKLVSSSFHFLSLSLFCESACMAVISSYDCHVLSIATGSIHHVIQYVHGDGPVGQHGILQEGDEILEVSGLWMYMYMWLCINYRDLCNVSCLLRMKLKLLLLFFCPSFPVR